MSSDRRSRQTKRSDGQKSGEALFYNVMYRYIYMENENTHKGNPMTDGLTNLKKSVKNLLFVLSMFATYNTGFAQNGSDQPIIYGYEITDFLQRQQELVFPISPNRVGNEVLSHDQIETIVSTMESEGYDCTEGIYDNRKILCCNHIKGPHSIISYKNPEGDSWLILFTIVGENVAVNYYKYT